MQEQHQLHQLKSDDWHLLEPTNQFPRSSFHHGGLLDPRLTGHACTAKRLEGEENRV